ncbi:UNVERIFIED_CONTAM: Glycosyltransferase family 92 protein [Sesamum indicum]
MEYSGYGVISGENSVTPAISIRETVLFPDQALEELLTLQSSNVFTGGNLTKANFVLWADVVSAAQEIVRCRTPLSVLNNPQTFGISSFTDSIKVSVRVVGKRTLSCMARLKHHFSPNPRSRDKQQKMCVCTMLRNQAGFLPEWIMYHARIGVQHWFIYDNNSDDEIEPREVAEVRVSCHSFGPSGQKKHPTRGVMAAYTCRLAAPERHKSIVKPEALHSSLINTVHHFHLKPKFRHVNMNTSVVVSNHYKYQVWEVLRRSSIGGWPLMCQTGSRREMWVPKTRHPVWEPNPFSHWIGLLDFVKLMIPGT